LQPQQRQQLDIKMAISIQIINDSPDEMPYDSPWRKALAIVKTA